MSYRAVARSAADDHGPSNVGIVCKAVVGIWAYSAVCGVAAVGLGDFTAAAFGAGPPAPLVRFSVTGIAIVVAGLSGKKMVLERVGGWARTSALSAHDR
jgi:hypothetical protein